ncbi:hypothetical protein P9112_003141 [Eukaryota sp. TZLM1-RC]
MSDIGSTSLSDDDDFRLGASTHARPQSNQSSSTSPNDFLMNSQPLTNQPFDEAIEVTSSECGSPNIAQSFIPSKIDNSLHNDLVEEDIEEDLQKLFNQMNSFTPQDIELEMYLRPFIPEFIPATGSIDSFVKPPRPDGKEEVLGISVLDEPDLKQSDPVVFELQLRAKLKTNIAEKATVGKIENAEKNSRQIADWVRNVEEIHRNLPPPAVVYSRKMPELESLMQIWPPHVEKALEDLSFPHPDIDLDLETYATYACLVLDIPVYENPIESLHVLFSLYSEFRSNQHFAELQ